jgi:hypothetical protein
MSPEPLAMPFPIGGPSGSTWREQSFSRAADYRFLARLLLPRETERDWEVLHAIEEKISAAEHVDPWYRQPISHVTGAAVERANSQLDGVETDLLRLAGDAYRRGQLPNLVAHVRDHLPEDDARRLEVEAIAETVRKRPSNTHLCSYECEQLLGAVRAASLEARRSIRRVRSFRNVLLVTALILSLCVAGVTLLGVLSPKRIPLCFTPETVDTVNVVCPTSSVSLEQSAGGQSGTAQSETAAPTEQKLDEEMRNTADGWDVPVVEIIGLLAAALAGAFALRQIRGTSTPYSLPVAVAVLKLPSGALTAVLGLVLMRGGFVPGLSALDTSAQILAWAVVFGYSQQILTRLVDRQANTVLENVSQPANPQLTTAGAPGTATTTATTTTTATPGATSA